MSTYYLIRLGGSPKVNGNTRGVHESTPPLELVCSEDSEDLDIPYDEYPTYSLLDGEVVKSDCPAKPSLMIPGKSSQYNPKTAFRGDVHSCLSHTCTACRRGPNGRPSFIPASAVPREKIPRLPKKWWVTGYDDEELSRSLTTVLTGELSAYSEVSTESKRGKHSKSNRITL